MKKIHSKTALITTMVLVVVALTLPTNFAYAVPGGGIVGWLYGNIVINGLGWFLGLSGVLLNYAINHFVIGFGVQYESGGIGGVVELTWTQVRDIFNLTFIFGLVYIGFKMILRTDDGQTKRWLINIILAALLVNFSLFITKFIIDFSNILAVEIMNINSTHFPPDGSTGNVALSENIADSLSISTSIDENKFYTETPGFSVFIGTTLVYIVGIFALFSAALLLIIRAAVLIVIMILSPFLFLGLVLPTFKNVSSQIWNALLSRAFYAPIYVLFLYLTFAIAKGFKGQLALQPNFADSFAAGSGASVLTGVATAWGPFIIIITFLMMSLIVAQKLGLEGANKAVSFTKKGSMKASKFLGQGALFGAKTVVAPGRKIIRSGFQKTKLDEAGKKIVLRDQVTGKVKKNIFGKERYEKEARGGVLGGASGIGRSLKYGIIESRQKDTKMGRILRSDRFGISNMVDDHVLGKVTPALEGAKIGFARDDEAEAFMHNQTLVSAKRRVDIEAAGQAEAKLKALEENKDTFMYYDNFEKVDKPGEFSKEEKKLRSEDKDQLRQQLVQQIIAAEQAVKDTNTAEFKNMPDRIKYMMTPYMDMNKYEALQNDQDIDKTVRDDMQDIMRKKIKSSFLDANGQIMTDQLKKLTGKEIAALGNGWAFENMDLLTNYHLDDIKRSGMMSDTSFREFNDMRKDKQVAHAKAIAADRKNDKYLEKEIYGDAEVNEKVFGDKKPGGKGPNRMMYKVKKIQVTAGNKKHYPDNEIGDTVTYAKLKGGKDVATHIHHDVFKEAETAAALVTEEWLITHAANDRSMTKLNSDKRKKLKTAMEDLVKKFKDETGALNEAMLESVDEAQRQTIESVYGALEYLNNSKGARDFLGKDTRDDMYEQRSKPKNSGGNNAPENTDAETPKIVTEGYGSPSQERERQNRNQTDNT